MDRIITTDVVDPSIQQPFTARSLDFLQDANKDVAKGFALNMIGKIYDTTKYYVLSGLYSYGTNQYKEGYVFFNGELYYCPGKSTVTAFTNVPVLTFTVSNSTIDPVTFSDGVPRYVHKQRQMILSDAVTGSGTVDLGACIFIDRPISFTPVLKAFGSTSVEVVGGFTAVSFSHCQYTLTGNQVNILFTGENFHIGASVRKLTIDLPTVLTGLTLAGCAIVGFQEGGGTVGFTGIATSETGVLAIKKIENNTDIPAMATVGYIYLSITLNIN